MNKEAAENKGLVNTHHYYRSKEEIKARIESEKVKYPKAKFYLVTVPDSKYSRGGVGTGYSIYATPIYKSYDVVESETPRINSFAKIVENLRKEFEEKMFALETEYLDSVKRVQEATKEIENA